MEKKKGWGKRDPRTVDESSANLLRRVGVVLEGGEGKAALPFSEFFPLRCRVELCISTWRDVWVVGSLGARGTAGWCLSFGAVSFWQSLVGRSEADAD
ncbi:hypothetical protein TB2_017557 [Malus domestica]